MPIVVAGKKYDEGFGADIVVEKCVIIEVKSVDPLVRVHRKQVLTYLRLSGIKVGLLINFGGDLLKSNSEPLVANNAPTLNQ